MRNIQFIVDSTSDIPDEELTRYNIAMARVPIAVDGREYVERQSFTIPEFYAMLKQAKELPVTSRVPVADYTELYHQAWEQGRATVINVTINSGGSGIYESACMAKDLFYAEYPQAKDAMRIYVVDSKTYSIGFGYPVLQAAAMAEQGESAEHIVEYLRDYFDRLEIYLACFTLEHARKSGRITAAAAFMGEVLGLRPIIAMIDGTTKVVEKVRGDRNVIPKLVERYRAKRVSPADPVTIISSSEEYANQLKALLEREVGREVPAYQAGAAIVINAGLKIVAVCVLGEKRGTR